MATSSLVPCHFCCPGKGRSWLPNLQILCPPNSTIWLGISECLTLWFILLENFPSLDFWDRKQLSPGSFLSPWNSFWVTAVGPLLSDLSSVSLFTRTQTWLSSHCTSSSLVNPFILIMHLQPPLCSSVPRALPEFWSCTVYPKLRDPQRSQIERLPYDVFISNLFLPFSLLLLQILICNSYLAND